MSTRRPGSHHRSASIAARSSSAPVAKKRHVAEAACQYRHDALIAVYSGEPSAIWTCSQTYAMVRCDWRSRPLLARMTAVVAFTARSVQPAAVRFDSLSSRAWIGRCSAATATITGWGDNKTRRWPERPSPRSCLRQATNSDELSRSATVSASSTIATMRSISSVVATSGGAKWTTSQIRVIMPRPMTSWLS